MNRGMEISADVADSTRSVIVEQVTNGVAIRMAVLYLLLSGSSDTTSTETTSTETTSADTTSTQTLSTETLSSETTNPTEETTA
jgi:hypothetical protein